MASVGESAFVQENTFGPGVEQRVTSMSHFAWVWEMCGMWGVVVMLAMLLHGMWSPLLILFLYWSNKFLNPRCPGFLHVRQSHAYCMSKSLKVSVLRFFLVVLSTRCMATTVKLPQNDFSLMSAIVTGKFTFFIDPHTCLAGFTFPVKQITPTTNKSVVRTVPLNF